MHIYIQYLVTITIDQPAKEKYHNLEHGTQTEIKNKEERYSRVPRLSDTRYSAK